MSPTAKRRIPGWVGLAVAGLLLGIGVAILVGTRDSPPTQDAGILTLSPAAQVARLTATGGTLDEKTDPGSDHVAKPTYTVDPPDGGDHLGSPAAPGTYTANAIPPDGAVVHSMEHGYVVIWYRPDLRGDDLRALRTITDTYPKDVLLVPRSSLPDGTPVAATAWHHRLLLPEVAAAPLLDFVALYRNQGPEKVGH